MFYITHLEMGNFNERRNQKVLTSLHGMVSIKVLKVVGTCINYYEMTKRTFLLCVANMNCQRIWNVTNETFKMNGNAYVCSFLRKKYCMFTYNNKIINDWSF